MRKLIFVYIFFLLAILLSGSALLGTMLAKTKNIRDSEEFTSFTLDLPSKVLDIRGDLITEYASNEKRELIAFNEISPHLIHALIAREDRGFYTHPGFSVKAILRAVIGQVFNKNLGGGSTLTQQTAGNLYADRTEKSIKRKIIELWWAIQMERRYSKDQIMELYLNKVYFGSGNIHGIEAAAQFYCGSSARDLDPAESAMLVIQLSSPIYNNPFEYPNTARKIQSDVLEQMLVMNYISEEEAKSSFDKYWLNFDYARTNFSGFAASENNAPWFSEYVRRELETMMYGTMNYYTGGYTIQTSCDLRHQKLAEKYLLPSIDRANKEVEEANKHDANLVKQYNDIATLIALTFNLPTIKTDTKRGLSMAMNYYQDSINPLLDICAIMFDIPSLQVVTKKGLAKVLEKKEQTTVEGTLICMENDSGYITAIIGGSEYSQSNQLIRATQSELQIGSAIKPLYYSAAIDAQVITEGSQLNDMPTVFVNNADVQYIPMNYNKKWNGTILAYKALARSLNIPAVEVLRRVGFDAAIDRMVNLTGISSPSRIKANFPRVYPLALGFSTFTPLEMIKAYSVFANHGRRVNPIAILNVQDRNGTVLLDIEKDLSLEERKLGSAMQIISPQTAFIMTDMLTYTVKGGTMYGSTSGGNKFTYKDSKSGNYFTMPTAGKTGTSQNWSDVWCIGYSPYYTTAVWFGFDRKGLSLGMHNEASYLAAPVWADFMYEIHKGKAYKNFVRPETGLVYTQVCKKSGQLMTSNCSDGSVGLYYLAGTAPREKCSYHESINNLQELGIDRIKNSLGNMGDTYGGTDSLSGDILTIDPSIYETDDEHNWDDFSAETKSNKKSDGDTKEPSVEDLIEQSGLKDIPDTKVEVIPAETNSPEDTKMPENTSEEKKQDDDKTEKEAEEVSTSPQNPFL